MGCGTHLLQFEGNAGDGTPHLDLPKERDHLEVFFLEAQKSAHFVHNLLVRSCKLTLFFITFHSFESMRRKKLIYTNRKIFLIFALPLETFITEEILGPLNIKLIVMVVPICRAMVLQMLPSDEDDGDGDESY